MKVKDLINKLRDMPPDAEVTHLWDGECRTAIEHVWLSKGGYVVTADNDENCYSDESRPEGAPNRKDDPHWRTPNGPLWKERNY